MEKISRNSETTNGMRQPHWEKSSLDMSTRQTQDHDQRQEEAERGRGLDPARVVAAPALGRVLGDVGRRAAVLPAERQPLQQSQANQQDRRHPADLLEGRQQPDRERGCAHHRDRHEKGVFPADDVADAPEHQRAERTHEKAGGVGREARQQRGGVVALGEEQRRKERRESGVQVEVVPLEDRAERRREYDPLLFGFEIRGAQARREPRQLPHSSRFSSRCCILVVSGAQRGAAPGNIFSGRPVVNVAMDRGGSPARIGVNRVRPRSVYRGSAGPDPAARSEMQRRPVRLNGALLSSEHRPRTQRPAFICDAAIRA